MSVPLLVPLLLPLLMLFLDGGLVPLRIKLLTMTSNQDTAPGMAR